MKTLKAFVSSPGDVGRERVIAAYVLERLKGEFRRRVSVEPYFWEHEPMRAVTDFQGNIPKPSDFDIVICILWSRLGSPLNDKYRHADGSPYASGTEYEFESSVEAHQLAGKPELLVYRNRQQPMIPIEPETERNEKIKQFDALQGFLKRWFLNPDGTIRIASNDYHDLAAFEEKLETNLRALIDQIAPPLVGAPPPAEPASTYARGSPFRQLRPFEFEDAEIFFGRTRAIDEVLTAMRDQAAAGSAFTLLFGGSGSGKSSLARAGVLPLLVRPGVIEGIGLWRWVIMRPSEAVGDLFEGLSAAIVSALPELKTGGDMSTAELARAMREAPVGVPLLIKGALRQAAREVEIKESLPQPLAARLVVLIDQFEEIFTLSERFSPETRGQFVKTLAELARSGTVWLLATLRSEFISRCAEVPDLVRLIGGKGQCHLLPPTESELRQMVRLPAIAAGLQFEVNAEGAKLDDLLVDAAGRNAGGLPLLEFALEELYKRRSAETWLTHAALQEIKGLEGAMESAADEVFEKLPLNVSAEFGAVFRGLVTTDLGEEAAYLRRVADLESLANTVERRQLIEAFSAGRLLVTGSDAATRRPDVQVAHEALFLHWPRLTAMLAENRIFLRQRARAGAAASAWRGTETDRSYLWWNGRQLKEAKMLRERAAELATQEAEFVRASIDAGQAASLKRNIAVAAAVVIAVAAGASAWLWLRDWRTEREVSGQRDQLARVLANPHANGYEITTLARKIVAKRPADSDTWSIYARALLDLADYPAFDAALEEWQRHVTPPPPRIEHLKGDREWKEKRKEQAIEHWSAWLRQQPAGSLEERAVVWRKLAAAHGELGQWTEAHHDLTAWIAASDNVEARVLRARASQHLRDWDAVSADIAWAQKAEPNHPLLKTFGPVMPGTAIDALNARVRKNPRDPAAWLARAMALARERQFEAALDDIERAQNLAPDAARLAVERAHLCWQLQRPLPELPVVRVAVGWTRDTAQFAPAFDAAQPDLAALSAVDARIDIEAPSASLFQERGEILLRLGQWAMAAEDFTRALAIENSPEALKGRAAAYRALGRTEEADADLSRVSK